MNIRKAVETHKQPGSRIAVAALRGLDVRRSVIIDLMDQSPKRHHADRTFDDYEDRKQNDNKLHSDPRKSYSQGGYVHL